MESVESFTLALTHSVAKYSQTDYFQANSLFVGGRETGDLLGVELHTGEGATCCALKKVPVTLSVCPCFN